MRFELSEQIHTRKDALAVLNTLDLQLRKISRVVRQGNVVTARAVEASFGSINRYDKTVVTVQQREGGILCLADVTYRPSVFFWVFFILGLLAYGLLFWVPIIFYLVQRKTVRTAITDVFARAKNEFEIDERARGSEFEGLDALWALKERGLLSGPEFESKKAAILSTVYERPLMQGRAPNAETISGYACPKCHAPFLPEAKYCVRCGQYLAGS